MKARPSHEKRRKEQLRKTRQLDKAERRAAKKLNRGADNEENGEDEGAGDAEPSTVDEGGALVGVSPSGATNDNAGPSSVSSVSQQAE